MAKTHSQWSASASARNMACPGSLALSAGTDGGAPSIYAAWGTAGHTLTERALLHDRDLVNPTASYLGEVLEVDGFDIEVDDDMIEATAVCVDYVRDCAAEPGAVLWLEEQFDLAPLGLPLQAGGTSDAVIWQPEDKVIEIVDYKFGRGKIVEIGNNTQLAHYGLGVLVKHPDLPANKVRMTIIQPRAPHTDGVIRSVEIHVSELVDFANDIKDAMHRSSLAITEQAFVSATTWASSWLRPGDHCTFCPAAGFCPALKEKSQQLVNLHWDDADVPSTTAGMSPEAVERDLDVLDLIEHWIKERRAYAHQLAEGGHQFDNWVLVEKSGHRRWNAKEEDEAAAAIHKATGVSLVELFTHKLKSPAGIERILGKDKGKIADLCHTPSIGKDLVRRSKAVNRQPALSLVDSFFNETEELRK